ncbi:helix-turn-helix transcriptional regulator [Thermoguttaceae bacterium LCP21S3_D4]|nr:WYL domain-containing protein [Lachnospiraceae bacterium]MDD6304558.1 WYL domain-containing protein [Lachnospiraceae bacterium]HCJ77027.1 WYL domain-containing protein [Roseburia sp.]
MGKTEHQKLKILYILELLYEQTDEKHAVKMKEIIAYLNQKGISAERKSIYRDLEMLQDFGVDILREQEYRGGYYIGSRDFELAELKLLVDAVQSSKFITQKKSRELIHKLEKLVSVYEAKQLQRQVVVTNRNKTINENIYYNIDMIYNGISGDVKIRFQYFSWNIEKEMELRRNGAFYEVSPLVLSWDDENYYLIAYDEEDKIIKHFRVDKMLKISLTRKKREGLEQFEAFDIASYSKKTFGMFAGEEETVTLLCENDMIGVVIDRFGQEVSVRKADDTHFKARLHVAVSGQFYGWLCGLGEKVEIIEPAEIREKYVTYLQKIQNKYS